MLTLKKSYPFVIFAAAAFLFVSCDEQEDVYQSTELSTMRLSTLLPNSPVGVRRMAPFEAVPSVVLDDELTLTCTVRDMEATVSATRGMPTGGTTYGTSRTVQDVYGSAGIAVTLFETPKDGTAQLMTPNAKKVDERTGSIGQFLNVNYAWSGSDDNWTTASTIDGYRWFADSKLRFFGVAPHSKAPSSAAAYNATAGTVSFSYTVSESTASSQPDLLVGCTDWLERPDTDPLTAELPMTHTLSGIHFIVDNEYTTSGGVTKSKDFKVNSITLTGVKNSGTVTYGYNGGVPTVGWSGQSGSATYSQNFGKSITQSQTTYDLHGASDGTITSSTEEGTTFMLVPQNLGSVTVAINYTYKGITKTTKQVKLFGSNGSKSSTPVSYGNWLPGKIYEYHINSKGIVAHEVGESLMTTSQMVSYTSQSNVAEVEIFGTSFNCADVLKMRIDFRQYFKNYSQRYSDITNARLYLELTDASGNVYDTHNSIYYDLKSEVPSSHSFSTGGDDASWVADISSYGGNIVSLKILVEFCNPSTGGKSGTWDLGYADVVVLTMAE